MERTYQTVRLFKAFQNVPLPFFYLFLLKTLIQESATYMYLVYVVQMIKTSQHRFLSYSSKLSLWRYSTLKSGKLAPKLPAGRD